MATLLLRLAAPLQSWEQTQNLRYARPIGNRPKAVWWAFWRRAMGLRRDDTQGLQVLNRLRFGVRVDQEGTFLVDYHTANNPTPEEVSRARRDNKRCRHPM